jgi:threonylcarbamoyladenosine tRNA methylthiotransferase MtaB
MIFFLVLFSWGYSTMNVAFYTLGCKLNYAETSQLQSLFEQAGHTAVPFGNPADIVIVNTCTVTENADRECRQIVRRALRTSPQAFVGVTGCYAQLQPEEIASIEGVSAVFGAKEKFKITELIEEFKQFDTPHVFVSELSDDVEFVESHSADNDSRTRAYLKLQDGCNYKCSFCTIPLARGKSRSMAFNVIPEKIRNLEKAGYQEIILSGINLGDYQAIDGEEFSDVVHLVENMNAQARLRIGSIEPNLLTQDIINTVAQSQSFVPHFHIPLQSGSPEILKMMRRRYKAEYYHDLIHRIKAVMPQCGIGVDVIVGFPGETDEHFEETYQFLNALPVSYLHVFSYSERENTPAAEYASPIPPHKRAERSKRLRILSAKKKFEFYASRIGAIHSVIPESRDELTGKWRGWTENYVRVEFSAPASILQRPMNVRILSTDGDIAQAELLEETEQSSTALPEYISILM